MMKRVTWFVAGAVTGAAGAGAAKRKARAVAQELTPPQVARRAGELARAGGRRVSDAVRDGRRQMRVTEEELRARLEGRTPTSLADELDDVETVLVDGRPVEAGQVIVLRQVRERDDTNGTRSPRRLRRRGA